MIGVSDARASSLPNLTQKLSLLRNLLITSTKVCGFVIVVVTRTPLIHNHITLSERTNHAKQGHYLQQYQLHG
jgi:hypothetical protein